MTPESEKTGVFPEANSQEIVDGVLTMSFTDRFEAAHRLISNFPGVVYPSGSPLLVRDSSTHKITQVLNPDGTPRWTQADGYSESASADYHRSVESTLTAADRELAALMNKTGLSLPELTARIFNGYLNLVDYIAAHYKFSTGHDHKHIGRDMVAAIEIFKDAYDRQLCRHPSDLLTGALGTAHDTAVGIIPRYGDFQNLATHADVGALIAVRYFEKVLPNCPNLYSWAAYSLMAHTHILKPRELSGVNTVIMPYPDLLYITDDGLVGFALHATRGADRADQGARLITRGPASILDSPEGGFNINSDGNIYSINSALTGIFIPRPDLPNNNTLAHARELARTAIVPTVYNRFDNLSAVGRLMLDNAADGVWPSDIARRALSDNPVKFTDNPVLTRDALKAAIALECTYYTPKDQQRIESAIDALWQQQVAGNPVYVHAWAEVLPYVNRRYFQYLDALADNRNDPDFGSVYQRLSSILDPRYPASLIA